ncbi:phage scaffolding protein [Bacillus sp. S/N-304-OC-R1]|uniref:phage scaffolding protein n=1 Tax=Bacillus sp. S/N-304-OC-R1 TaxID=2758034 RepID=UPI001C8F1851|nr:phage scaffolding protein [Bacillus sp. S/N-304-OC-R1]MBY0122162.1 phage scaffolding protein [Bacillus sp. S/N-304-OC-R1]
MKREFLEGLGLDKEKIDSIMAEHGKTVESHKSKQADLSTSLEDLKKQLEQRDKDLKELKKQAEGSEDLQKKLADLQKQYDDDKTNYETKLKETQLTSALKLALTGKVHDADLVTGLIDKTKIELGEDGNVTKGLDEQIKTLQESKSFLFVTGTKTPGIKGATPPGGDPGAGGAGTESSFGKKLAEEAASSNKGLEEARKSYFE